MGEDSAARREVGPWSLEEGLNLFSNVCKATGVEAIKKSVKLVIQSEQLETDEAEVKQRKLPRYDYDEDQGELRVN